MLEKLKLTHFRKHEDVEITLAKGLQLVVGRNEGGKSSIFEAIAYALFGSSALRTTLADAVTWGRPESSMRVELTITLAGRRLTFSRGKSGAEVIEDGRVTVTGQKEVSSYASNLLGCDGPAAANLIIASQNAMRGSLEQGPKATAQLIEDLASFDLFDVLLERIQANLVTGAPATFEARVKEAEVRLDAFVPAPKPDEVVYNAALSEIGGKVDSLSSLLANKLRPEWRAAEKAYDDAEQQAKRHREADDDTSRAGLTLVTHRGQRAGFIQQAGNLAQAASDLSTFRAELVELEKAAGAVDAYAAFKTLPNGDHEFEGDAEAFAAWLQSRRDDLVKVNEASAAKKSRIRELEATLINSSTCGFCGQDVSAFPDVARKNDEARTEIEAARLEIAGLTGEAQGISAEIAAGNAIDAATRKVQALLPKLSGHVTMDTTFTPPRVVWDGEPPEAIDIKPARERVAEAEREVALAQQADASASALIKIIEEDTANVQRMAERRAACPAPIGVDGLSQAFREAKDAVYDAEKELETLRDEGDQLKADHTESMAHYNARKGEQQRLQEGVTSAKKDLADLAFNNTLLKKIRTARPVIADKLWNTVLAAVSTMFSQMRGESSVVSKDSGGFKVNGQPIEALSGSTLDILGLAIRTALVKTFIPHAPFMLLDEAAAACDEERTGSLLGFVASSGFEQVVLVTHESSSEAIADNVIQL